MGGRIGNMRAPAHDNQFIKVLRQERTAQRITQRKLAQALGICSTALYYWEMGIHRPSLPAFADWAQSLGFEIVLKKKGKGVTADEQR